MSRRKLVLMCLLLMAIGLATFVVRAIAGDELPPDPGDDSVIGPILMTLKSLI